MSSMKGDGSGAGMKGSQLIHVAVFVRAMQDERCRFSSVREQWNKNLSEVQSNRKMDRNDELHLEVHVMNSNHSRRRRRWERLISVAFLGKDKSARIAQRL